MPLLTNRRLAVIWLHWVVANAAGGGVLGSVAYLFAWYALANKSARGSEIATFLFIEMGLIVLIAYVQQLILCGGGLQVRYWIVGSIGGIVAGIFTGTSLGAFCVLMLEVLLGGGYFRPLPNIVGTLTFGLTVGAVQSRCLRKHGWQSGWWVLASGLGSITAIFTTGYIGVGTRNPGGIVIGIAGWGVYGLITATCLVGLLARRPERQG
jgi:hypothetical protein